jgi:pyruvate/2-oxoglutarate dehydrogenase complex dihydrolipoamide acyltransferase (E2) component
MHQRSFGLLAVLFAASAAADHHILYECVDQNGNKRFTNLAAEAQGCKVLNISPLPAPKAAAAPPAAPVPAPAAAPPAAPPVSAPPARAQAKSSAAPTPANFPRVDTRTQQHRDNDRRRILEQELNNERKLLEAARKELAEQEAVRLGNERNYQRVLDRLEPYRKRVKLHEDNVTSINRELTKLR